MIGLLWALAPTLFLTGLFVAGVLLFKFIVVRFLGHK